MKKVIAIALVVSFVGLVSSCGADEDVTPKFDQIEQEKNVEEGGTLGEEPGTDL